jgi:hypothetical protein
MNVTDITRDGDSAKFVVSTNLEDFLPSGLDYELVQKLAGRTYRIHIMRRRFDQRASEYYARTRMYVSTPDGVLPGHPPFGSVRGDGSAEDKAWRAYNRLELEVMRAMVEMARPIVEAMTFGAKDAKWSFSRKAGCSCGCSPGFREGSDHTRRFLSGPCDVWVSEDKA